MKRPHLRQSAKILAVCLASMQAYAYGAETAETDGAPQWGDMGHGMYRNPILKADFSDPDVIRVGDRYYMTASDFHYMVMLLLESSDMVNWQYASRIYDRLDYPGYDTNEMYAKGSWAPALRYHDGKYYVYFCTPGEGLFMTQAETPQGPWSPLHQVKAVEGWEDPCPLWDDDGCAYLGHSLYGAGPIIVHRMSSDGRSLLDDGVTVYEGPVAEGTKMHKIGGKYYMSIPEGGVRGGWQTVLRSDNVYGPYENRRVLEQGSTAVNGPHQGALVDTPEGEWWFYHFQETDAQGRVVHLQPVRWRDDGWPEIGVDYDGNGVGEPVAVWTSPLPSTAARLSCSDDFDSAQLSPQWQWNHNPADTAWSLTEHYGSLTLHALHSADFRHARNTLTQRAIGDKSQFTAAIDVSSMAEGQRTGIACMGKGNRLLGVKMHQGRKHLYLSDDTTETEIAEITDTRRPVYLRLDLDFPAKRYSLSYSHDNKDYTMADSAFYLHWGHWKGVRPAIYTYSTDSLSPEGLARVHWVEYTHDGNNAAPSDVNEALDRAAEQEIVAGIALTHFADLTIDVRPETGGVSDRSRLQAAIDTCSLLGGGHVAVHPGTYRIDGNIVLKSNVDLHLEEGALLQFSSRARRSDRYGLFISGYPEKPVRDIEVRRLRIWQAATPHYTHCTDGVTLEDVWVNGEQLPATLADESDERVLDVY